MSDDETHQDDACERDNKFFANRGAEESGHGRTIVVSIIPPFKQLPLVPSANNADPNAASRWANYFCGAAKDFMHSSNSESSSGPCFSGAVHVTAIFRPGCPSKKHIVCKSSGIPDLVLNFSRSKALSHRSKFSIA
jgi:hypothetical protein